MRKSIRVWWAATKEAEHGRVGLWLPVAMGTGVALYFALLTEPPTWLGASVAVVLACAAWLARARAIPHACCLAATAAALGFASAQFASFRAPPLEPLPSRAVVLTGTVSAVELLPDNAQRITLTAPRLHPEMPPLQRDLRIRLRPTDPIRPETGDQLSVRALLRAPQPSLYPGAWDTQRDNFFNGLAGGGTALGPAVKLETEQTRPTSVLRRIQQLRETIARRFADGMPGASGAIGSALFTGFMAAIPRADQTAFRDSGLAHLLSVSGLHVAIVIGLVFGLVRMLLALSEHAALHWPCKQIGALAGLFTALLYTPLAGAQVPLLRSVAMAALVVLGILVGRRAFTLRGLALAAVAILLIAPQELVGPSAQMSFSAVLALIAGHNALSPVLLRWRSDAGWVRRAALYVFALSMTSLLAGSASAPFGIYHFGRVQVYFIVANLLAVPLCGIWVMPWGLAALALMPFGQEWLAFIPLSWGIEATLWIAYTAAALPAATFGVPHMPLWGLLAYALGLIWLCVWRAKWRRAGILGILVGLASPMLVRPADILVSNDARLIAARVAGDVVFRQEGSVAGFVRDGFSRYWAVAAPIRLPVENTANITCDETICRLRMHPDGKEILILMNGEKIPSEACVNTVLVIAAVPLRGPCPEIPFIDRFTVWRSGAHAIWLNPAGPILLSDRQDRGDRLWVEIPLRRRPELPPAATE